MGRIGKLLLLAGLVILLVVAIKVAQQAGSAQPTVTPPAIASGAEQPCTPGDQDPYIYAPERLQVLRPCLHISGMVDSVDQEDDGDVHLRLYLDSPYQSLLADGNKYEEGDLVIEPVCYSLPLQADAMRLCASNPDRIQAVPRVGDHVWMEGRYVIDLQHWAWSELHPLYRWGKID